MRSILACAALCLGFLSACGSDLVKAGGQYSGFPDTTMGDPQKNRATGTISTGGTMWSRQQGYLTTPTGR